MNTPEPSDGGLTGQKWARTSVATIRDVAQEANVSPSTVSNLLNGRGSKMSESTREQVERAMEALSYRPSRVARSLRTGKTMTIGLVVPSVGNPFWGNWARVVEARAAMEGLQVLLCNSARDPERERLYVEQLQESGVQAVILGGSLPSLDHLHPAIQRGLKIVAFDREVQSDDEDEVTNVSVDNYNGSRLAAEHLIGLGHKRIGFISGPISTVSRRRRMSGYHSALAEAEADDDDELVWLNPVGYGDVDAPEAGERGMLALLNLKDPPTAVVTINDMYAIGACAALHKEGLDAPRVSVVGFDDIVIAALYNPPLTTVRQPLERMADYAIKSILGARPRRYSRSIVVMPEMVVRNSSGPARTIKER